MNDKPLDPANLPENVSQNIASNINENVSENIKENANEQIKEQAKNTTSWFSGWDNFDPGDFCCLAEVATDSTGDCCLAEVASGIDSPDCWVATAVLETNASSNSNSDLTSLRAFRDRVLVNSAGGRLFIRFYYRWGSFIARFIMDKPRFKWLIRTTIVRPLARFSRFITGI